jgi:integrase/recombinase XerD
VTPRLDPKRDPARHVLKYPFWPDADQAAWRIANMPGDPLEPGGIGADWAPATRQAVAKAYGRWLGWLSRHDELAPAVPLAERLTPDRALRYIEDLQAMIAPSTVVTYIVYLRMALEAMAPQQDFDWLRPAIKNLKFRVPTSHAKRPRLIPVDQLMAFGVELMDEAERGMQGTPLARASRYRDGLIIALLTACPLRRGNLAAIEIGRHLVRRGEGYWLLFDKTETKNRVGLEFPFPQMLIARLARYLSVHRSILCEGPAPKPEGGRLKPPGNRLWVSTSHSAMSVGAIYYRVTALTTDKFGHPINPHLFRDCAATSIAIEDPEHVLITMNVLGHTTLRTSEKYYNHAQSLEATRRHQAHILALRRLARPHHDQRAANDFGKE